MIEELRQYCELLVNAIPFYVYEGALSVLCIGIVILFVINCKKAFRRISILLLIEYLFLIFSTTVFYRTVKVERAYDYSFLWSYSDPDLIVENIMNVVVFIPIGFLLGCVYNNTKWWMALSVGGGISVIIEMLQLISKTGFSELDDVMHNTLGCLLGYGIMTILRIIFNTRYNNV